MAQRRARLARVAVHEALLKLGSAELGTLWNCSEGEVSRRVNGDRGVRINELCDALDKAGVIIAPPSENVRLVNADELKALRLLARRSSLFDDEEDGDE